MKFIHLNRRKRQFRNLSAYINKLIKTHQWENLNDSYRKNLIFRLNHLFRQIYGYFSSFELKKILAGAAIFIGLPFISNAQSFGPPQLNPFGLAPDSVYLAKPTFADIDNDSDLDLFVGIYEEYATTSLQFYENTGTVNAPNFNPPVTNPFGISIASGMVGFPAFADIDNDGDQDLFVGVTFENNYFPEIQYFENTGTPSLPHFAAAQINPFGISGSFGLAIPTFADLDHDGDLDMFTGEFYGNMKFFENTGTVSAPAFAPPVQNPFGLTATLYIASPAFSDIDHDGDLDLFVGEYYGNFQYFRNSGTLEVPAFAAPIENPFGLAQTFDINFPAIADLDNDGDDDILVGEYYGMFQYFQNNDTTTGISEPAKEVPFSLFPNPARDQVNIRLGNSLGDQPVTFEIADLNGRIFKSGTVLNGDLKLRINDITPGLYFVRVKDQGFSEVKKLIVY